MAEKQTPSVMTYTVVCVVLIVLTGLTVLVSFFDLPGIWHVVLGLLIASLKGALVVLFFMHAIVSSRVTWIVIMIACFWLGILLVLGLTDYVSRGLVPIMTGH